MPSTLGPRLSDGVYPGHLVVLGFRTLGSGGPLNPTPAFQAAGSAGLRVSHETLLEGAATNLTSRKDGQS